MKSHSWGKVQWTSVLISLAVIILSFLNSGLGWQLLGISEAAFAILMIFVSCLLLWLFVAIDWPSILCLILLGLGQLPNISYGQIFSLSFGNATFVFLLFTFIVTYGLEQTPALRRFVSFVLQSGFAKRSPWNFVVAFLTAVLVISCFISPTILFMIAFPIYEEIMQVFGFEKGSKSASVLIVALFSSIAIGTAMTPINHVFAITAMGLYQTATGVVISNLQYMSVAVPAGLAIFAGLVFSLKRIWKLDLQDVQLQQISSLKELPAVTKQERWTVMIFVLVVLLWILPECLTVFWPIGAAFLKTAGLAFPPMIGTLLLALIRVDGKPLLNIQTALSKGVYWPSLLLVGATLSLGTLLTKPEIGVLPLLESGLTPLFSQWSSFLIVFVFVFWAGVQTNFSSNLVTVSVVTTVLTTIAASSSLGINVAAVACLIGFMASLAYMTPPSMPYVAISVGSGWTSARDAFLYGTWLLVLSILAAMLIGYPLGMLLIP